MGAKNSPSPSLKRRRRVMGYVFFFFFAMNLLG